jgi:hypothetical protein
MSQFQSWSQGWRKAGVEAENKRAKMLEAFNVFKQGNPDATAAEFQEYVNNVTGNAPWLRGALPAEEVLNKLGARNEYRMAEDKRLAGLEEERDRLDHLTKKNTLKNSLNKNLQTSMLSASKEEIEDGSFVSKWKAGNPDLAEVYGGDMSDLINVRAYNKVHSEYFRDNHQNIMRMLESDPDITDDAIASNIGVNPKSLKGALKKMRDDIQEAKDIKNHERKTSVLDYMDGRSEKLITHFSTSQDHTSDDIRSQIMGLLKGRFLKDGEAEEFVSANPDIMKGWLDTIHTGSNAIKKTNLQNQTDKNKTEATSRYTEGLKKSTDVATSVFGAYGNASELLGKTVADQKYAHMINQVMHNYANDYVLSPKLAMKILKKADDNKSTYIAYKADQLRTALLTGEEGLEVGVGVPLSTYKEYEKPQLRPASEWAAEKHQAADHLIQRLPKNAASYWGRNVPTPERVKEEIDELNSLKQKILDQARDRSWQSSRGGDAEDHTDTLIKKIDDAIRQWQGKKIEGDSFPSHDNPNKHIG